MITDIDSLSLFYLN